MLKMLMADGKHIPLFMEAISKWMLKQQQMILVKPVIEDENDIEVDEVVDVTGLTCPMPIVKLKKGIESIESNQILELHATDRGTLNDLPAWSKNAGHTILKTEQDGSVIKFWIKKK